MFQSAPMKAINNANVHEHNKLEIIAKGHANIKVSHQVRKIFHSFSIKLN